MKRWVFKMMAVLSAVLMMVGCGTPQTTTPVTDGFTCHAAIQYREMAVEGTLTCTRDKTLTLAFSLPKSLQGVTLGFDGAEMTMELGGMRLALPTEKVPESALICCLLQMLTASHPVGSTTDEGYVITGEVEGIAYALVCDPTSGLPLSLSVPEQELEAVFTDMTRHTTTE